MLFEKHPSRKDLLHIYHGFSFGITCLGNSILILLGSLNFLFLIFLSFLNFKLCHSS